jgi:hypothetical protein
VAPLTVVPSHRLAAVCAPAGPGEFTAEALWRHEEVVEALMRDRDLLPVRYGTRLPDEPAAEHALVERQRELAEALDRVRGAVELSLRVLTSEPPPDEPSSGADYLRAKSRSAAEREAVVRTVHEPLAILARATRRRPRTPVSEPLRAAYLVDRAAVETFTGLVSRLQDSNPGLRTLCTGPWPPYSFAGP